MELSFYWNGLSMLKPMFEPQFWLETPLWQRDLDSLQLAWLLCLVTIAGTYTLSIISGNYSMVDRIWSISPFVYAWFFVFSTKPLTWRGLIFGLLPTLWGVRLTYNFARKGGYKSGEEDYRWPILRKRYGMVIFQLLNATFIAPFQNLLIFLFISPAYIALTHANSNQLNLWDLFFVTLFLAFVTLETVADQ